MMLRIFLFVILFAFSIGAMANGDKPKPPAPEVKGGHDTGNRELGFALAGIAALVGIVIYLGNEKKEKVAVQPTPDLKGATATVEWRF